MSHEVQSKSEPLFRKAALLPWNTHDQDLAMNLAAWE
jgi:hypothetical protein